MTTMTITIERTPRTVQLGNVTLQTEELSVTLPFARKPCDLSELGGGSPAKVLVTETREMSTTEFDEFAASLLRSRTWLNGRGGTTREGTLCVEVCAPGAPTFTSTPKAVTTPGTWPVSDKRID